MNAEETRYAEQIEELGLRVRDLDFDVTLLHMDDGHPAPGIRIHLADETAELLCAYSPVADVEGLEDLDLLNLVLTRSENLSANRPAAEATIGVANEMCPFGHFGLRSDGDLYYRAQYITEYGELPEVTSFADSLKLVSFADLVLRPPIVKAGETGDVASAVSDLYST